MTFVRAAFAFVLLTPVVGFVGGRYMVTAMLAQNPQTAMAPNAPHRSPTPRPVAPTVRPTAPPTTAPSATPKPAPTATIGLTPTIVLLMSTSTVTPPIATAVPRPTAHRVAP